MLFPSDPAYWQLMFKSAVRSGIYGIPLGLSLGLVFELLNRKNTKPLATIL